MDKNARLSEIIEAMDVLNGTHGKSGSLFLYGDMEDMKSAVATKGNMQTLASVFGNYMNTNDNFNRIMMSFFGAYLSEHPEQKKMFLSGLELANIQHGVN